MAFLDDLKARNPELFPDKQTAVAPQGTQPQVPPGAQQVANMIDGFMPIIEQTTGLTRREISLQLLKTGFKGGNLLDVITGLSSNKPVQEAKFQKYVKTLAIWVPVALFLIGISIVAVYAFLKLTVLMLGGL